MISCLGLATDVLTKPLAQVLVDDFSNTRGQNCPVKDQRHFSASKAVTLNLLDYTPSRAGMQGEITGSEKGKVVNRLEAGGCGREGKAGWWL